MLHKEMIFVIMRLEVSMRKQKRVAVINDVTGFGRCAAAVAQLEGFLADRLAAEE